MTEEKKPIEIVFAPGCFDNFDGTQEELDELVAQIHQMADTGELFEKSKPVDIESLVDDLSPEEVEALIAQLDELEGKDNPTRKLQ
jgi:hypothetical protein